MDDFVVIKNVPEEITEVDGDIVKSVQPECFTDNKIEKSTLHPLESPKENHIQYVRFNNECESNNDLNIKTNGENCSEHSSNTSSTDSFNFRKIILTPIEENETKLSNGFVK